MAAPTRPVARWHGGKFRERDRYLSLFPPHGVYVEPYGAATGCEVFLRGHTRGFEIGMTSREAMELLRGEKQGG